MTRRKSVSENAPEVRRESFVVAVFGQFLDPTFWRDLFKTVVSEMVSSFLMALGGSLLWYGKERRNQKIADIGASAPAQSPVASKAFGYTPTPSYQGYTPSYTPPPPAQASGDVRFPGFGR